jgi:hypothetical protein
VEAFDNSCEAFTEMKALIRNLRLFSNIARLFEDIYIGIEAFVK